MNLTKYKNFLIIILLCELRNNIANDCSSNYCSDCCCYDYCGICCDCINLVKEKNTNKNYDYIINDDKYIDNKNFIAVNYKNSQNKYNLEVLKEINSTCFNLKGNEYSTLKEIYIDAFLFFVNIKEEGNRTFQKTEDYTLNRLYRDLEKNNYMNINCDKVPFWNSYINFIKDDLKYFFTDFKTIIKRIEDNSSYFYNFKEIVFFLFGYLRNFIEKNKNKKTFTVKEYTSQVESMLNIFLYITQGFQHCSAGQYEAIQIAFINVLEDFLKDNDIKIKTEDLCKLFLNFYAKKIFNMVFSFTKIQEKDYSNISCLNSLIRNKEDLLTSEKSMFTIYLNNNISDSFGFKYNNEQPLEPITSTYAISYESIKFLVEKNTYGIIKINNKIIDFDLSKKNDTEYIKKKKNEFAELCTEIMIKAMSHYFDLAFGEIMFLKIVESTKDNKIISAYNKGDDQKKKDIVKKILIKYGFFENKKYDYKYVIDD